MHKVNYIKRGFGVLALTAGMILIYPFIHERLSFLHNNFRSYSLLESFSKDEYLYALDSLEMDTLAMVADSASIPPKDKPSSKKKKTLQENPRIYQGSKKLTNFLSALTQAKSGGKKVRIGYFGDSMIEGDLVTESLRGDLQKEFGGQGVGFVPVACPSPGFRKTIRHSYSNNWKYHTVLVPNPTSFPYSIAGNYAYLPGKAAKSPEDSWVKYEGTSKYEGTKNFLQAKLYYGSPTRKPSPEDKNWVAISTEKGQDTVMLKHSQAVNTLKIGHNVEALELKFNMDNRLPVYGVSFEGNEGVYVDNYAVRGNSGLGMLSVPDSIWRAFNRYMDFDLVILHYGLNIVQTDRTNYKGYEKYFKKVVALIQEQMPTTDILIISVTDKSSMIDGKMQTDPSVPHIVKAQKKVAKDMGVAFLDLYRGMGGKNTMIKWVASEWATSDYTHVNRKGADRIAKIIQKYLMTNYQAYLKGDSQNKQLAKASLD